jgi:hypothetical protein
LSAEIQNSERLKKLEAERAKIQRDTVDHYKQFLFWSGVNLTRTFPALAIMVLCGLVGWGFGVLAGLNVLPSAVACSSVRSWCYHLRINKETTVAPEIPLNDRKDTKITVPKKKKSK